ncbi:MAG: hypothetical protein ACT4PQ_14450 [Betaproteobacteria bacterium]
MNATSIVIKVLIAAALSYSAVFAASVHRPAMGNDTQRVESALHGKTSCMLVDAKVFCAPAATRAPIRLAYSTSD